MEMTDRNERSFRKQHIVELGATEVLLQSGNCEAKDRTLFFCVASSKSNVQPNSRILLTVECPWLSLLALLIQSA